MELPAVLRGPPRDLWGALGDRGEVAGVGSEFTARVVSFWAGLGEPSGCGETLPTERHQTLINAMVLGKIILWTHMSCKCRPAMSPCIGCCLYVTILSQHNSLLC